jgi:pSer/pThr/pTyr-binding forkhead associated (FHA) protein
VLASLAVSRHHARVVETAEGLVMEDMGSNNGIAVNGIRRPRIVLESGVPVQVGDIKVWVERSS